MSGSERYQALHDMRTPVTSIAGFATTLSHMWETLREEERKEFVRIIELETARLSLAIDKWSP